jgi:D-threonate/D-erythronate kinase
VTTRLAQTPPDPSGLHYAKIDSLLRGHPAREIAAWWRIGAFERCIIAPAFPHQARVTRGGRQYRRTDDGWAQLATDLSADLAALGLGVVLRRPGDAAPAGLSLWDAESEADLDAIVATGRAADGQALWCGSGGLAGALTRSVCARDHRVEPALERPILGLFGSDQAVTADQVDTCGRYASIIENGGGSDLADVSRRLNEDGVALVRVAIPKGASRADAATGIARAFGRLALEIARPATLVVAGGETLSAVCHALETDHLELVGQIEPGVPCSFMRGGRFDGVRVVSKSGAFGDRDLLRRLVTLDPHPSNGVSA